MGVSVVSITITSYATSLFKSSLRPGNVKFGCFIYISLYAELSPHTITINDSLLLVVKRVIHAISTTIILKNNQQHTITINDSSLLLVFKRIISKTTVNNNDASSSNTSASNNAESFDLRMKSMEDQINNLSLSFTRFMKEPMFSSNTNSRSQHTHDDSDTENEQSDESSNNVDVPTDYQLSDTLLGQYKHMVNNQGLLVEEECILKKDEISETCSIKGFPDIIKPAAWMPLQRGFRYRLRRFIPLYLVFFTRAIESVASRLHSSTLSLTFIELESLIDQKRRLNHTEDPMRVLCYDGEGVPPEAEKDPNSWQQDPDASHEADFRPYKGRYASWIPFAHEIQEPRFKALIVDLSKETLAETAFPSIEEKLSDVDSIEAFQLYTKGSDRDSFNTRFYEYTPIE
ncbi:hypothetical protein ACTFIR_003930 [Dictyostelium discoideum]